MNKILTIEASSIGIACVAALEFDVPVIFAKKSKTKNIAGEVYSSKVVSFTHNNVNTVIVSKKFLNPGDRVLIIDDFLANGAAMLGLIDIVRQAGATLVGCGIAVEKSFQPGGDRLREMGVGWSPWPGGRAGRRLYPLCRRGQVNSFRKRGSPDGRTVQSGDFGARIPGRVQ